MFASFFSYLNPTRLDTPRITILDLPFEILEEILTIVLLLPSLPSPSSSFPSFSRTRTACLRTCKAFSSAGERELYSSISVSTEASWRILFGPKGLFSLERGRNLGRFVTQLRLGGSTYWLWQEEGSTGKANLPLTSSVLDAFPSLVSLILETSMLSQLSHPSHIHPLDALLPQLQPSKPFTLTLVTYGPSSLHLPLPAPPLFLYFSALLEASHSFPTLVEVALPRLTDRHSLHQSLGFSSPPWTSSLDTLVLDGGPILEALHFTRQGNPFLVLAGSTWSFRRLVIKLSSGQTHFNGARVFRTLFSMDTPSTPIPLLERLERVELRVGKLLEAEIRRLWEVELKEERFSEAGKRLGGLITFLDEEGEGGAESRLVEV